MGCIPDQNFSAAFEQCDSADFRLGRVNHLTLNKNRPLIPDKFAEWRDHGR
jgi:hypothetical protein